MAILSPDEELKVLNEARRNYRRRQLVFLRANGPAQFAERYRQATGLSRGEYLPRTLSEVEMITAILECEERELYSPQILRAIAA